MLGSLFGMIAKESIDRLAEQYAIASTNIVFLYGIERVEDSNIILEN
jgi:hypothetical protein